MQKPVHLKNDPTLEIAWWIDDSAVQFRITGEGYTVPSPTSPDGESLVQAAVKALGHDGAGGREGNAEWWEGKRREMWATEMSSHLRGSFGRPDPGKKMSEIEEKPEDWIQRLDAESVSAECSRWRCRLGGTRLRADGGPEQDDPKQKKDIEFARNNFALLAIRPTGVEYLELKPTPNKRTQWTKRADGEWDRVEVAP